MPVDRGAADAEHVGDLGDRCVGGVHPLGLAKLGRRHLRSRPPRRPRARAAASPARVRSRIRSRSNSISAAKTWKTSEPAGVVVSIDSCAERKPTPRSFRAVTVSMRWRSECPSRGFSQAQRGNRLAGQVLIKSSTGQPVDHSVAPGPLNPHVIDAQQCRGPTQRPRYLPREHSTPRERRCRGHDTSCWDGGHAPRCSGGRDH